MKYIRFLFIVSILSTAIFASAAHAQSDGPRAIVMTANGPIMPPMLEYIKRGIEVANRQNAEILVIQLNTPGGSIETMLKIIDAVRASNIPVVVYVAPKGAIAGSAGALITMAGSASAMAPETAIGASSPVGGSGENLESTLEAKQKEILKAKARTLITQRGTDAVKLAESMIDEAKAVTANEALEN
jgi:membrane-bound serine protease (ClpP class)